MTSADDTVGRAASRQLLQRVSQVQVGAVVIDDSCKLLQEACKMRPA